MKIAVIPARGGSKRIPRKNILPFAGRPIIAYSIEAARRSGLFDRVIVSTDDAEIAGVAAAAGAEIPFLRPMSLADDHTGTNAVVRHALEWLAEQGDAVTHVCCIYATAPFLQSCYLQRGYDLLMASRKSFAFSVTSFPFPVQRALRLNAAGEIEAMYPEYRQTRSQDLPAAYHDAGQFYWGTTAAYLRGDVIFSTASLPVVLPRHMVQDIDTLEDWRRAELMYEVLRRVGELT
jgi:pseudaminic acid cytidylyltransferase